MYKNHLYNILDLLHVYEYSTFINDFLNDITHILEVLLNTSLYRVNPKITTSSMICNFYVWANQTTG